MNVTLASSFLCPTDEEELSARDGILSCPKCGTQYGSIDDNIPVFSDAVDKVDFFELQAADRLSLLYSDYSLSDFQSAMTKTALWEMDELNKSLGVAQKLWWEPKIGKITGKRILEVGCGVNYMVPYWLASGNEVFAFDICRENVFLLRQLLRQLKMPEDKYSLAVADAQTVKFKREFDYININNVLHHIEDKRAVLNRMGYSLRNGGKLLLVEPNYYYPPRWMIETELFDPLNFVKSYFVRNHLIEEGEKAVIFSQFTNDIRDAGFQIQFNEKDRNFLGYFLTYWFKSGGLLPRILYALDHSILGRIAPRVISPFEYIIAAKPLSD